MNNLKKNLQKLNRVECINLETDAGDILTKMITCTRKAGTLSIIGVYNNTVNHFPIDPMMEKHLTVTGGQSFTQKHWKFCLEKILSGEFDPTFVISHNLTLSQIPDYYQQFNQKQSGALKCFVRPENFTRTK